MTTRTILILTFLFSSLLSFAQRGAAQRGAAKKSDSHLLFVETESFKELGGWKIDQQSFDVMGSSYLLAHGMGRPVPDANTTVNFPQTGKYHVWVRTKDWAPYPKGPGKFQVLLDDQPLETVFGASGSDVWQWYYGGETDIAQKETKLSIKDLTGFDGRCDALLFTTDDSYTPPQEPKVLMDFRRAQLGLTEQPADAGHFDMVVVGGGMAGTCAAISGARRGLKVALIQNRPVLGGNNSSEIRVHLMGDIDKNYYPKLGRIVDELDNGDPGNGNPNGDEYGDERKLKVVEAEENISLFLNTHVDQVEMKDGQITAVIGRNIATNQEYRFSGELFADCTGDGTVGYLAGADYRAGRESQKETGESYAPEEADNFTLGTSNLWASVEQDTASGFPECPWALQFSDEYHIDEHKADWEWETGFGNFNTITEAEQIRDHNLRAIYGNWAYLKNHKQDKYSKHALAWVAYIGGKRESRRLLGDHILTQMDIENGVMYPDGLVTATWTIDLHFPNEENSQYFPGEEFFAATKHIRVQPYTIPYRCLYSRNISNLFMAGRDISTTHVAFGSTRVMRTCGMMGEAVGYAAALCRKYETTPRGIYDNHLDELVDVISEGILEVQK
uniref:FAD-dependent oxidoreductase n=1 Tax=Roseihalotalea indica TaxID=2867963 RepID=A0AA49JEG6_9BACT|nr:FAD-dependent oxidoreductase [Tunicatimonas sp. TK19036]